MYKTFALYKEERSFDVLNGTIPYFVYGDVKLAIKVDGQQQANIPDKKEEYVVEPKCDNGKIEWDYENWGPIIKNIKQETRCSLNFVKNNNMQTLGKLLEIDNLDSIDTLLANGNIDKLVKSKSGMTYLAKSPTLVSELQSKEGYNDEIKKKILNSEAISEDLKYEAGLPCYLIKNKQVLKVAGDIGPMTVVSNEANAYPQTFHYYSSYGFSVNDKNTYLILCTLNKIKLQNYTKLSMNYMHFQNYSATLMTGKVALAVSQNNYAYKNEDFIASNMQTFNNSNHEYSNIELDFKNKDTMEDSYIIVGIKHEDETPTHSVVVALNTIALY